MTKEVQGNGPAKGQRQKHKTAEAKLKHGKRWNASDIKETPEQLRALLLRKGADELSPLVSSRVTLLLLLKTGAAASATEAHKILGVAWSSASKWLNTYEQGGLQALMDVDTGGRVAIPPAIRKMIQIWGRAGVTATTISERLESKGIYISRWGIYPIIRPPGGQSWQCKTTLALDNAIAAFAKTQRGGSYSRNVGGVLRHNLELVEQLMLDGMDYPGVGKIAARQSYGRPGTKGSHLGFRFDEQMVKLVSYAAKHNEAKNQTLRRLIEAGLIVNGFPPDPEPQPRIPKSPKRTPSP
jgi:transposase